MTFSKSFSLTCGALILVGCGTGTGTKSTIGAVTDDAGVTGGGGATAVPVGSGGHAGSGGAGTPGSGGTQAAYGGAAGATATGGAKGGGGAPVDGDLPTACSTSKPAAPVATSFGKANGTVGVWQNVTPAGLDMSPSLSDNFGAQDVLADPVRPSDLYAFVCHQGVWKSTDYGETWAKVNTGANGDVIDSGKPWGSGIDSSWCRDPNKPPTLYTLNGGGPRWGSSDRSTAA